MKRVLLKQKVKRTGRPRSFNEAEALNRAMFVFWRHGYETTSMSVLSSSMGMNAPSIYATFGDKKSLFLKTLDLYVGSMNDIKAFVDRSPSAFAATHEMLKASVIRFTGPTTPKGCMLASATASCSAESADIQAVTSAKRLAIQNILQVRIQKDIAEKLLPETASAYCLASLTIAVIQGMSVLARDGTSRRKLMSLADTAMLAWPSG